MNYSEVSLLQHKLCTVLLPQLKVVSQKSPPDFIDFTVNIYDAKICISFETTKYKSKKINL